MNKLIALFAPAAVLVSLVTPVAHAATGAAAQLESALNGKELACWKRGGDQHALLFSAKTSGSQIIATGNLPGMEAISQVVQVSTGETLLIQAAGPDLDEGEAVILLGTFYLNGDGPDGPTNADAVVYGETGPGDGSGTLVKLSCELR